MASILNFFADAFVWLLLFVVLLRAVLAMIFAASGNASTNQDSNLPPNAFGATSFADGTYHENEPFPESALIEQSNHFPEFFYDPHFAYAITPNGYGTMDGSGQNDY